MAEKMPSSVKVGSRPTSSRMRWYSSGFSPCAATSSGVIGTLLEIVIEKVVSSFGVGVLLAYGRRGYSPCKPEKVTIIRGNGHQLCRCVQDRKSTRPNSSHVKISYAIYGLKK